MVTNLDIEIFKKSGSRGHDFSEFEQHNFLAPTGQLSKWVWDKHVGANTPLNYVTICHHNRSLRSLQMLQRVIVRYCQELRSSHKCKYLKVIFGLAKYCFLIPFIRLQLVDVKKKSHLDPSALRLLIPQMNFKEFCTALVSLIVYKESSTEIN